MRDEDEDDCDHLDADEDVLTGILTCSCGYRKWLTSDEVKARQDARLRAEAAWERYITEQSK